MDEPENKSGKFNPFLGVVIIVAAIFAGLILLPNLFQAHSPYQHPTCINNLHQIEFAKNWWAQENGKTTGSICTEENIKPFIHLDSNGHLPKCPQGGIYAIGKIGEKPTCTLGSTVRLAHVLP